MAHSRSWVSRLPEAVEIKERGMIPEDYEWYSLDGRVEYIF